MTRSRVRDTRTTPPPADWRHEAACRGEDPELFFPIGTTGLAAYQIRQAQAVCGGCEVRQECLLWSLDNGASYGVWGGMDEEERRGMVRRKEARR